MVEENIKMIKSLRKLVLEVEASANLNDALPLLVKRVKETLQGDACSIFISDEDRAEYVMMATLGLNPSMIGKARLKFGEGLVGLVGVREEPISVKDATQHSQYRSYPSVEQKTFKGFLGVPIISQGESLGVLVVQTVEARTFAEEDVAFLMTLATQIASSIAQGKARGALQMGKRRRRKKTETVVAGVPGSPGVAIGQAVVVFPPADLEAVPDRPAENIEDEISAFEAALSGAKEEIHELQRRASNSLSVAEQALFDAYLRILDSRTLMNEVEREIQNGLWAQAALKRVIKRHIVQFESLNDPYLQERATDIRDLGRRVLAQLQSTERHQPDYPKNSILVSEEVTPAALMEVPEGRLVGVMSGTGSSNSHVAILARALGLPTVMGVTGTPINELSGEELIVDGYNGEVYFSPSPSVKKEFQNLAVEELQLDAELANLRDLPAETTDGKSISLYINTGLAVEGGLSLSAGAEGVGLYRTEMPFMLRERFPSQEEQRIMYRQLLTTFSPRPVIMRTLDIGGDKSLPYFPVQEENPFLGWRGIRITLDQPEIFLQQIRAMLLASEGLNNLSIMLPMVTSVYEIEESLGMIQQVYQELINEDYEITMPKLGIMVEVPAAVYQSYDFARRVDFVSVGSNDLIQYLLAVDRNNPRVADLYNGLHPAVLRALVDVVKGARRAGKKISICGELASDPVAVVLLVGMGFDALSMNARALPRVKWVIRNFFSGSIRGITQRGH